MEPRTYQELASGVERMREARRGRPLPYSAVDVGATNSYRAGWELFLRHVAEGAPLPFTLFQGAKGVQLAELAYRSGRERRWIAVPKLDDAAA